MGNPINIIVWGADADTSSETPYVSEVNSLANAASLTLSCYDVIAIPNDNINVKEYIGNKKKAKNIIFMELQTKSEPKNNKFIGTTRRTFGNVFPENAPILQEYNFIYSDNCSIGFETNVALAVNIIKDETTRFDEFFSRELNFEKRESE